MINKNGIKYLNKIVTLSCTLFFTQLLAIFLVVFYVVTIGSLSKPDNNLVPSEPTHLVITLNIIFIVMTVFISMISLSLAVAIIVFTQMIKIDDEKLPNLIIFSILNFFIFVISPLIFFVLAYKQIRMVESEILAIQVSSDEEKK
ncbi:MAG: hypothetical protein RR803_02555 [Malacoplasma sp.]